jgi:hypothetical protein
MGRCAPRLIGLLLGAMVLLTSCGLGYDRTTTTRGSWGHGPQATPTATPPGGPSGLPGVKIVTLRDEQGLTCTMVFWDGLYVGGTC